MAKKSSFAGEFPIFAVTTFILAIFWLLTESGVVSTSIPWLPVILIVVSIAWIVDFYS